MNQLWTAIKFMIITQTKMNIKESEKEFKIEKVPCEYVIVKKTKCNPKNKLSMNSNKSMLN